MVARLQVLLFALATLLLSQHAAASVSIVSVLGVPPHGGVAHIWGGQGASAQEPVLYTQREALSQPEGGAPLNAETSSAF